jgi:uracil-DNA glycosylase family 4
LRGEVLPAGVENVTDRTSNPFGMSPPCADPTPGGHDAVFGYGDANADLHVIGDHPRTHGGGETGIPFGDGTAGDRLRSVFSAVGLLAEGDGRPTAENCYLSYLHPCWPPAEGPSEDDYDRLEPFFDAELRAIGAHVLLPVGDRALERVLREYTNRVDRVGTDAAALHATEVHGRGWLVVPIADPATWGDGEAAALEDRLATLLDGDYRQISDLGRFQPHADPYYVR